MAALRAAHPGLEVELLRRPTPEGGKPGAVNYLLRETAHRYDFFLLCDNNSVAFDPHTVERALPAFADGRVAVAQSRNVVAPSPGEDAQVRDAEEQARAHLPVRQHLARPAGWRPTRPRRTTRRRRPGSRSTGRWGPPRAGGKR